MPRTSAHHRLPRRRWHQAGDRVAVGRLHAHVTGPGDVHHYRFRLTVRAPDVLGVRRSRRARVYFTVEPLGNGPNVVPLPRSTTNTSAPVLGEIT